MSDLVIVSTGVSNIASVRAMALRAGIDPVVSTDPGIIRTAKAVILPGVGSFASGMERLRSTGIDTAIRQRVACGHGLFAICLGLQMLFESSEESPGVTGLGVATGTVTRFSQVPRIPHMGWNELRASDKSEIFRTADVYYANSYRVTRPPAGWRCSMTRYGGDFIGAMELTRAPAIVACQFHPELSGTAGMSIFNRWLALCNMEVPC